MSTLFPVRATSQINRYRKGDANTVPVPRPRHFPTKMPKMAQS